MEGLTNMPPKPDYKISVEFITPEQARAYLATNKNNRNMRKAVVEKYAYDMANGKWEDNGETIAFSVSGALKNGQHRLAAIIKSNVGIWCIVVRNVPELATIYDIGAKRKVSDFMAFQGAGVEAKDNTMIAIFRLFHFLHTKKDKINETDSVSMLTYFEKDVVSTYKIAASNHSNLTRTRHFCLAIFIALKSGVPIDILLEFCELVNTGYCNDDRKYAAITLRNKMQEIKKTNMSLTESEKYYDLTLMMLDDYLHQKPRKRLPTKIEEPKWAKKTSEKLYDAWEKHNFTTEKEN